jgi:hypothetical protein
MHGFPLVKELQTYFGSSLSFVALSTAFEDFELNTLENTRLLLNNGELVGETLKAQKADLLKWDTQAIGFPVLMDEVIDRADLLKPKFIDGIIENIRENTPTATSLDQINMRTTLATYFGQLPKCGFTFAANLMRGTPSFFLFTDTMEVVSLWFGHASIETVKEKLRFVLERNN